MIPSDELDPKKLQQAIRLRLLDPQEVAGLALCGEPGASKALELIGAGAFVTFSPKPVPLPPGRFGSWRKALAEFLNLIA